MAMAGGCRTIHLKQELSRSPAFCLPTITEIDSFLGWTSDHADSILTAAESTTRHGRLLRVEPTPIQQWVVLDFVYDTGTRPARTWWPSRPRRPAGTSSRRPGFTITRNQGSTVTGKPPGAT